MPYVQLDSQEYATPVEAGGAIRVATARKDSIVELSAGVWDFAPPGLAIGQNYVMQPGTVLTGQGSHRTRLRTTWAKWTDAAGLNLAAGCYLENMSLEFVGPLDASAVLCGFCKRTTAAFLLGKPAACTLGPPPPFPNRCS